MIEEIRLKNFKCFSDLSLECKGLTVLTGANGVGKTSVFHALLLARQISLHPDQRYVRLNGIDGLELGGAGDIVHHGSDSQLATVEMRDAQGVDRCWSFGSADGEDSYAHNAAVRVIPDIPPSALADAAPQFCYLCAERLGPRDTLGCSAAPLDSLDVGPHGEFAAQVLCSCRRSPVSDGRLVDSFAECQPPHLLQQTEGWMAKIVRPIQIHAEWLPETSITRLRFKSPHPTASWIRAPNAGFGISYALPIVVGGLRASKGGLFLVENPEAHLHPAGQSMMGRFLARVAADGVQVFLETHSDHVLNGIRVAVAKGEATPPADQTIIHFFPPEGSDCQMPRSMTVSQAGRLSAWPSGFFDQEQIDLGILASIRRRKP